MKSEIDHYETLFDKQYLRWFHLNGRPALVRIKSVRRDVQMTLPGGAKTKKACIDIELVQGNMTEVKPLVLNTTNAKSIAAIHGDKPSQWLGKEIVLYEDETEMYDRDLRKNVKRQCIRVRAKSEPKTTTIQKDSNE